MSRATELTDAVESALREITPTGFSTDIKAVYGVGEIKPDKAPLPCLLVRIDSDAGTDRVGVKVKRSIEYQIEAVFPRTATLQELQLCHHDILRALGYGQLRPDRPLAPGWVGEESAEFDMAAEGGTHRTVTASIGIEYIETY